jgi:prenylcysteine alpha-carboxyl methylesterase
MGKALSAFGIVVVTPDYRNFPQGVAPDMIEDVTASLQWVFENIHHFGGDPENVTLVGQSAGAHLGACTLLERIERKENSSSYCTSPVTMSNKTIPSNTMMVNNLSHHEITWELKNIRSFIGISGPYNIEASMELFHRHGFDRSIVERIMDHKIAYYSPSLRFYAKKKLSKHNFFKDFPPVYLFHGTADKTCPWNSSDQFLDALETCGIKVSAKYFKGKTHTDPILEDPISGDDFLLLDIIEILKQNSPTNTQQKEKETFQFGHFVPEKTFYPSILVRLARIVNPF